jgi:hypothetical protein
MTLGYVLGKHNKNRRPITNNKAITYDFNSGVDIPVLYQRAREFGIDLTANF